MPESLNTVTQIRIIWITATPSLALVVFSLSSLTMHLRLVKEYLDSLAASSSYLPVQPVWVLAHSRIAGGFNAYELESRVTSFTVSRMRTAHSTAYRMAL